MIRVLLTICLMAFFAEVSAQQFPVFKDRKDSIQYAQASDQMWTSSSSGPIIMTKTRHDSLRKIVDNLRTKAIGWGYVYKPRTSFIQYADLKAGKINPDSVIYLSISNVGSAKVPIEVLACKNLEQLEIVNSQIGELQSELNSLTKLTSIYLYNNVPSQPLKLGKNDHVNYLRIAGHHPDKLPKSYKNFSSLDSLNINRSMASRIPDIRKNKQLKTLHAVDNQITLKGYKRSRSLEYLDLRLNYVELVPNSIGRKYKSLKALSFNRNRVKTVKRGLGKLKNLEYLSFYGNMIPEIPASVYKLTKLHTIDLFENQIEYVSPEIKNLQNLRILYLANNKLYSLPEEIGQLKNLEEIYVYNNRMDTLPASMDNLEKLKVLWVNDNFFHAIPSATYRVKNMNYLDASQNFIKRVPDEIVKAKLSVLILSSDLMNKERENQELFDELRKNGTRIIYYTDNPSERKLQF